MLLPHENAIKAIASFILKGYQTWVHARKMKWENADFH